MSKEWKCGDCCCFKTDSCLFGEMDENSSACSETVVDHNKAYLQGQTDVLNELFRVLEKYKIDKGNTPTTRALKDIRRHFEKLKEN